MELLRAVGDEVRAALYTRLAASPRPLGAHELADHLGIHVNTVRLHLERIRECGVLSVTPEHRGTVGRPQLRYALAPDAPALGADTEAHAMLASLLADAAERAGVAAADAAAAGHDHARSVRVTPGTSALDALTHEMDRLGFEPAVEPDGDGDGSTLYFLQCPFRDLAQAHPELVCSAHQGLCEGIAAAAGGNIRAFHPLSAHTPCRADLVSEPAAIAR